MSEIRRVGVILYEGFEPLDVFGPVQIWAMLKDRFRVDLLAEAAGLVASSSGPQAIAAERVAGYAEYEWHRDADWDPFAELRGLV